MKYPGYLKIDRWQAANCAERYGNRLLTNNIEVLRQSFRQVKGSHPFEMV
jgi:hypothetical protein